MTVPISKYAMAVSAFISAGAGSLAADVTITASVTTSAGDVLSPVSIKGMKMREDSKVSGGVAAQMGPGSFENTRILKLEERETINISSFEKTALVQGRDYYDKAATAKMRMDRPKIHLQASGQERDVAGQNCQVYDIEADIPLSNIMPEERTKALVASNRFQGAVLSMKGTACLAAGAPGWREYKRFYAAASDFYRSAPSPDGPAAILIGTLAEKGMIYEMTMKGQVKRGHGGAVPLLSQIVSSFANMSMKVVAVSIEKIPPARFEIPGGTPTARISY